jgi:hypothetical protein
MTGKRRSCLANRDAFEKRYGCVRLRQQQFKAQIPGERVPFMQMRVKRTQDLARVSLNARDVLGQESTVDGPATRHAGSIQIL